MAGPTSQLAWVQIHMFRVSFTISSWPRESSSLWATGLSHCQSTKTSSFHLMQQFGSYWAYPSLLWSSVCRLSTEGHSLNQEKSLRLYIVNENKVQYFFEIIHFYRKPIPWTSSLWHLELLWWRPICGCSRTLQYRSVASLSEISGWCTLACSQWHTKEI